MRPRRRPRPGSATSTTVSRARPCTRESKDGDGALGAPAYLYAGPAAYVSRTGERPMRVIWRLGHELPADVFAAARVAAG